MTRLFEGGSKPTMGIFLIIYYHVSSPIEDLSFCNGLQYNQFVLRQTYAKPRPKLFSKPKESNKLQIFTDTPVFKPSNLR